MRLDKYLSDNSLVKSRTHARELIEAGFVLVDGREIKKPSHDVSEEAKVEITGDICPYVSRGGLKLERAIESFCVDVAGKTALDIGASTGGFTDVLLQNGAVKVFAVDSGHGQLADKLKSDRRVVSLEGFNARNLRQGDLGAAVDIAVCDVSFISQTLIHGAAYDCLKDGGIFIGLVKPQFECTRDALSKGGIVKEVKCRFYASERVYDSLKNIGFSVTGFDISPISGGDGNTEYLICAYKGKAKNPIDNEYIRGVVFEKHSDNAAK